MSETAAEAPKIGDTWGDDISEERQRWLDERLTAWDTETDHGDRKSRFDAANLSIEEQDRLRLTGADVFYLAKKSGWDKIGAVPNLHLEGAQLSYAQLKGAHLREAQLQGAQLSYAQLEDADLREAQLQGAELGGAHLEGARLREAQLQGAHLDGAHLEGADLSGAQLQGAHLHGTQLQRAILPGVQLEDANLGGAQLEDANLHGAQLQKAILPGALLQRTVLTGAHLEGANLTGAQLEGANLTGAHLQGAHLGGAQLSEVELRSARLDRETRLNDATLASIFLDQIVLDNTNLTVVSWERVAPLGDERRARAVKGDDGKPKSRATRVADYEASVRANRLLATALRAQGLNEESDNFAFRAALMQRGLRFQRRQFGRWFASWGLAALSGYGYRLGRIFAAYAIVVLTFAALFLLPTVLNGAIPTIQQAADALQISLNAIHGRVFFVQFGLDTLQSWLATAESVIGIVIEGVFVAMIIQRLFR
jgi:uncharacterized protein YjbI with pentapeptide repeats